MNFQRAYRPGRRSGASTKTRAAILEAVHSLLGEGAFHQATVEDVARRAGVARATVYQHFRSRLGLVDAMCETFDANPNLIALRESVVFDEPAEALDRSIASLSKFWATEEAILQQLYGVAAIDDAARDLVQRQVNDRRNELTRLVGHLRGAGLLSKTITDKTALAHLLVLTSFETFEELRRRAAMTERKTIEFLQRTAHALLTSA